MGLFKNYVSQTRKPEELSVEKAKEYNKAMIAAGRCEVLQGDVSDLQLPK